MFELFWLTAALQTREAGETHVCLFLLPKRQFADRGCVHGRENSPFFAATPGDEANPVQMAFSSFSGAI